MNPWLRRILVLFICLAAWEAAFRLGWLNPLIFGSPSLVVAAAMKDGATFLGAFRLTLYEIVVAMAIAWIGGVGLGVLFGAGPRLGLTLAPLLSAAISVPLVVLYPVIVAWLGIGPGSKIAYGAATGFFPIALATLLGIRAIDTKFAVMAAAMGANRGQILYLVMARLALPAILSGLRVGTALTVIAVLQSEMLSAADGLGFWISYYRSLFEVGQVYFGIILALVVAAAANAALTAMEHHWGKWRTTLDA